MVGLLNAPRNTRLYKRLASEGRLLHDATGDNTDSSINFVPKMGLEALVKGYRKVIRGIYSPRPYYQRVRQSLRRCGKRSATTYRSRRGHLRALLKSAILLGIVGRERLHYWRLLLWTLLRRPRLLPVAVSYAICGFHYRKLFEEHLS